jgi:hypothetical protein
MDEVIEEITRQIIYKALKIKILVEKGRYLPKIEDISQLWKSPS